MIHTGRHRYKTHAGIPHGSTNNLGSKLAFYFQHNTDMAVDYWNDQSSNDRHAVQETAGDQAALVGGGLDFEAGEGDHYDWESAIEIASEEGFALWIVCKIESAGSNMTVLSLNNTNHFLEFKAAQDSIRVKLASTTTSIDPGDGSQNDFATGATFLMTLQREAGATGNLNLWKNGGLLAQDSQAANTGDGEFVSLGVRNADRFFDGIMFDVAFVETGAATDANIARINSYLCAKHGIEEVN